MKYIQKRKNGVGYSKLLKIHKAKGCYDDTKNDNSKVPKVTTRTDILKDLLNEQGYICAYCMRSISIENATIEHIVGQNYIDKSGNKIGKQEDTNYDNMLAVCQGNFCQNETHCDSSRSKYQTKKPILLISPLNRLQMSSIKFTQSGTIYYENIKNSRKKIIKTIKRILVKHKFDKKFVKKELEYWEQRNSSYKAFCQVAIFELRKYI
jgi:uncharacterized protein (TIGR02646 family)